MQTKKFAFGCLVSTVIRWFMKACFDPLQCGLRFLPGLFVMLCAQHVLAVIPLAMDIQTPTAGDHALHILSPNLLELYLVNTKQPDPARVDGWDWVDGQKTFVSPDMSSVRVIVNGQTNF